MNSVHKNISVTRSFVPYASNVKDVTFKYSQLYNDNTLNVHKHHYIINPIWSTIFTLTYIQISFKNFSCEYEYGNE